MTRSAGAVVILLFLAAVLPAYGESAVSEPPRITVDELKARLGDARLVVVDVRSSGDWNRSDRKIAGAVRGDPNDVSAWAGAYPKDTPLVLYCS